MSQFEFLAFLRRRLSAGRISISASRFPVPATGELISTSLASSASLARALLRNRLRSFLLRLNVS